MNDFIYVPVENIKELLKKQRELCYEAFIKSHCVFCEETILNAPEPSISPIQEEWKEAVINEAEERFPTNSIHNDYELKMPAKIHRRLCRERFIQGAEWAKQYIEENIINKTT